MTKTNIITTVNPATANATATANPVNPYRDALLSLGSLAKLPKDERIKPTIKTLEKIYKALCLMEDNRFNAGKYNQFQSRVSILIDTLLEQAGMEDTQHNQQFNAVMQAFACKFSASKKYGTEAVKKASMATFKKTMLYNHKAWFMQEKWVEMKESDLKEGKVASKNTVKKSTIWDEASKAMEAYIKADMAGDQTAKEKAAQEMEYWQKMKAEYTAKQEAKKAKKAC